MISRREFAKLSGAAAGAAVCRLPRALAEYSSSNSPLLEFGYSDVSIISDLHEAQLRETHDVLMNLSEDSLLKPFRTTTGTKTMLDLLLPRRLANGFPLWRVTTPSPGR